MTDEQNRHGPDSLRDLVISALAKVILDESPAGSIIEAVEAWQPLDALTPAELDAVERYFAVGDRKTGSE